MVDLHGKIGGKYTVRPMDPKDLELLIGFLICGLPAPFWEDWMYAFIFGSSAQSQGLLKRFFF